jgi:hypothetical protein
VLEAHNGQCHHFECFILPRIFILQRCSGTFLCMDSTTLGVRSVLTLPVVGFAHNGVSRSWILLPDD